MDKQRLLLWNKKMRSDNRKIKNMNKKIIILTIALLTAVHATGQIKHEFSIYGGGGLSTLLYEPAFGKQSNGFGGLAGLGYTLFFNNYFGIGTGAEIAFYNANIKSASFLSESQAIDMDGNAFLYKSNLNNFQEEQTATSINIPLMLNLQTGGYHRFYAALGAKLGIPFKADYNSSVGEITTSGYYEFENFEYTDMAFLGFGTFSNEIEGKGDLKFKLAYLASAELGMKWSLSRNTALYTGFYADYGLNNIAKREGGVGVYNAENPQDIGFNSVLASQHKKTNGKSDNFADKVSPLAVGVKIKLAFGNSINKEKEKKEKEKKKKNTDEVFFPTNYPVPLEDDALRAEREAYLREAAQRRQNYKQSFGGVDEYGLSVVMLNAVQKRNLGQYIDQMKKDPSITLHITGHTCNLGSDALNMRIGQERADVAKDYMVEEGISPSRIKTFTMGKSAPLAPNTNEANRKKNRRLEIQILK